MQFVENGIAAGKTNPEEYHAFNFETTEELIEREPLLSWSKKTMQDPDGSEVKFSHFAQADNNIMAVYGEGYTWVCVGFLMHGDQTTLQGWTPKYR